MKSSYQFFCWTVTEVSSGSVGVSKNLSNSCNFSPSQLERHCTQINRVKSRCQQIEVTCVPFSIICKLILSVCRYLACKKLTNGIPLCFSSAPVCSKICFPSSLLHMIRGSGCPVASHVSVALSPSVTVVSPLVFSSSISGGTGNWSSCYKS